MRLRIWAASGTVLLGMARLGAEVLWTDNLQAGNSPWGFSGLETEHPIDETVSPADANGANLSRAANPLGSGPIRPRAFPWAGGSTWKCIINGPRRKRPPCRSGWTANWRWSKPACKPASLPIP